MSDPKHVLKLKPRKDRRVRRGHPWVFSNEVASWGPKGLEPGGLVEVRDSKDRFLARGYCNKGSLIAVRILGRHKKHPVDEAVLADRLRASFARRQRWLGDDTDAARLVAGEGDELPGLVVDRYADVVAIQLLTQGIERLRETILEVIRGELSPKAIVERGDNRGRALEGLPTERRVLEGELPEAVEVRQDGLRFLVDVLGGQRTGFFLDRRRLRQSLGAYVAGQKVLDVGCYTGATAAYAVKAGATSVVGVDSSLPALELAEKTFAANQLPEAEWAQGDAFQVLQGFADEGRTFGCVLVDPPTFAASKKNKSEGVLAHTRLHKLALRVLEPGGILVSTSDSVHVDADELGASVAHAGVQSGRSPRLLEVLGASPDHPGVPGMPESRPLCSLVIQA